ncbi:kinesin [Sclerotinia borealis F-4128]|uniref:Kinesin n=1 Tax=Sclerotinia borealis (strain F-4128) TaxID=1432307 RepID=W9CLV8_SCLBF|nr:kinesin [Sclerotinia borealis F-4128]
MASSPPESPQVSLPRPASAIMKGAPRSSSRMSMSSKAGGSRASDEDGKTAVKVAVRVRPPLQPTDPGFDLIPQRFQRPMLQVTSSTNLAIDSPQGKKIFVFDRVFDENVDQEGIWEYLVESTNAFIQGYNVSMLAYGQSGAGKSFTMGTSGPGEQGKSEIMGVIPRAAMAIFEKLGGGKPQQSNRSSMTGLRAPKRYSTVPAVVSTEDKTWTLKATYVEIYNEQLRDLLVPEHIPAHEREVVTIRENTKGHILLTGLHQVEINTVEDLMAALNFGSMIRQTDATAINAKSSRSHAVFSLNLVQRKIKGTQGAEKRFSVPLEAMTGGEVVTIDSKFHFVDLAGSERLKNTGAQGERAKEGISINAGLASLGKVISQLSSRQAGSHVSYRDSKLTRLLQDSLGGNAITYMIACVTPAEFHLSETLNTVHYAQRARAIQSKPRIQQVSDESDKQAVIDRLKAEVAFLRDQITNSESGGDRRSKPTSERPERQNEREVELHNQLLDTQENYTALSQRHAKLISELARARDEEVADNQAHENTLVDSATERLKRSNSFAEAVEQVVLEYEKTIQSLEHSLSNTRSSLSNTETLLLEKETKCAYTETVNQQLQARLQKLIDREANTEHYLHDLETRLEGHTSGEDKNSAIVMELRKEIARVRENEATGEDYISTLEERLAEADQDSEMMQREIDRLEHVIERQRSLGKLDSLLYDLDNIRHDGKNGDDKKAMNSKRSSSIDISSRRQSLASRRNQNNVILETENESDENFSVSPANGNRPETDGPADRGELIEPETPLESLSEEIGSQYSPQSPAQSRFVEDKLENVTQELVDLKVEHEATVGEYDLLSVKYEDALRTLAELQDAVDEARHPGARDSMLSANTAGPTSFLADARMNELKDGGQYSSSRSLSSELSSAGESPSTTEQFDAEAVTKKSESVATLEEARDTTSTAEVKSLRKLGAEQEEAQVVLTEKYAQLEEEHTAALDLMEELKAEVSKARLNAEATSPRSVTPVIRRKSSQNVMIIDRAHRSFASLRNIAAESFEHNPDVMANFELNLNTAMHELHTRSERIQELEADVTTVRKELDLKTTIISGLARERSSMKASPMDMSVVSTMQDQIMNSENQIKILQELHNTREKELLQQIAYIRTSIKTSPTFNGSKENNEASEADNNHERSNAELKAGVVNWEGKHQIALTSMQTSQDTLETTILELERQLSSLTTSGKQRTREIEEHQTHVSNLQREIDEHKAAVVANTTRFAELEQAHASTREQLEEAIQSKNIVSAEMEGHKTLGTRLEEQIAEHENIVKTHQEGLSLLQVNHAKEIEEIRSNSQADHEAQLSELKSKHRESTDALSRELSDSRDDLAKIATQVAFALGVDVSTEKLQDRITDLVANQKALSQEETRAGELEKYTEELSTINDTIMKELETVKAELASLLVQTAEGSRLKDENATVADQLAALRKELHDLETKNKKNSRLVEELEDQLASNFDEHQAANNRLSTLQTERNAQLDEAHITAIRAQTELEAVKEEYATLQAKLEDVLQSDPNNKRSNSMTSRLHKSASVTSLPSPPPAIPLPPLPGIAGTAQTGPAPSSSPVPPTPTQSSFNSRNSKDIAATQIQEDQEARIRMIEKHLFAEKQLTSTLEEALTDLEKQSNKVKADCDAWRKRANELEAELKAAEEKAKNGNAEKENRWSLMQVEEEKRKRKEAELARAHLEERMNALSSKKKKKGSLNCF